MPVSFHDHPEYNTPSKQYKTDQLPIFVVITGLPTLYHNTSSLYVSPSATITMVACGRVLTLISLVITTAFSFSSPFFVSPSATLAARGSFFYGVLPCHSAFFVSPSPRHAGGTREGLPVVCLFVVSAFPSTTFLRVFPGFIAKPFRGVGVGFEDPHLSVMFYLVEL